MQPHMNQTTTGGFSNFGATRRGGRGRGRGGRRGGRGNRSQFQMPAQQQFANANSYPGPNTAVQPNQGRYGQPHSGMQASYYPRAQNGSYQTGMQYQPSARGNHGSYASGHHPTQQQHQNAPTIGGNFTPMRRNTTQYCWSHGACSHSGYQCVEAKPGHIPHATFQNRCGGCNDFCF